MSLAVRRHQPLAPEPERLLIVAPSDPAELVAAMPVLVAAIRDERWRHVAILAEPEVESILDDGPCEPYRVPRPRGTRGSWMRSVEADACLLLTEDRSWVRTARRAGIPVRAGVGGGLGRYDLTHAVVPPRLEGRRVHTGMSELWRDVGGLLGVWPDHPQPRLDVSPASRAVVEKRLGEKGIYFDHGFVLCAPASDVGPSGLWPPERYAAVLDRLVETRGLPGLVVVGAGDEDLAEEIVASAGHPVAALLYEEGYSAAKATIQAARIVVTTDAFHRAAAGALGTPCVYLAGPGPAERGAVTGEVVRTVAAFELECAPCLRARCPLGHHRCMLELDPEVVFRTVERFLLRRDGALLDHSGGARSAKSPVSEAAQ